MDRGVEITAFSGSEKTKTEKSILRGLFNPSPPLSNQERPALFTQPGLPNFGHQVLKDLPTVQKASGQKENLKVESYLPSHPHHKGISFASTKIKTQHISKFSSSTPKTTKLESFS